MIDQERVQDRARDGAEQRSGHEFPGRKAKYDGFEVGTDLDASRAGSLHGGEGQPADEDDDDVKGGVARESGGRSFPA